MICVQDKDDADYLRSLRTHGWVRELPSYNSVYTKKLEIRSKIVLLLLPQDITLDHLR